MTQLERELIRFLWGLRRKDMKPYSPKSIYNCYCAIARCLKDNSLMYPRPNLFDETCYGTLLKSLDGKIKKIQDLNPRSADKSDPLSFEEVRHILNHDELRDDSPQALTKRVYFWLCLLCGFRGGDSQWLKITHVTVTKYQGIQVIIPREKNNTGGIKKLDNTGRKCEIPPDQNGKFTPTADILYYMNKRPSGYRTLNGVMLYQTFMPQQKYFSDNKEDHSKEFLDNKEEYDSKEESHNYNNKNKKDDNSVKEK
ncbi:37473_t:CDS:2, partial [Gigaspora margarita]